MRTPALLLLLAALPAAADAADAAAGDRTADTVIVVDKVQVTAIKQGLVLRERPVAATIVGSRAIGRHHVDALKDLSQRIPNFHAPAYGSRMTSSIYVRGLGARIDQPVVGLNVDNVPVMNKDCFDNELFDAERIEVLRGPQSTLYGRNTMGGVVNVYTLSPLTYQGVRLMAEYGSGATWRVRASSYAKIAPRLGVSVAAYYNRSDGFFRNRTTGERCDWERLGGGRWKTQWRNGRGLAVDNTLAFSLLDEGGYPYAYMGETLADASGAEIIRRGQIGYADPCSYRRTTVTDGLTVRYDGSRATVSSITSYQFSDDEMILDQDFLPIDYFTLRQSRRDHSLTEDVIVRSRERGLYRWLFGAFGFYRHGTMEAPVTLLATGIERLILENANAHDPQYRYDAWDDNRLMLASDFRSPSFGGALYHESTLVAGHWRIAAGLRFDVEHARLRYRSSTRTGYTATDLSTGRSDHYPVGIDLKSTLRQTFTELLPKFSVLYAFDEGRNLYLSVARGYKAGGFNTQMFSDVLQQELMHRMGFGAAYDPDAVVSYKPEYSWNYEAGGHFSCMEGTVRGDFALFWIECRDQQLTVFPPGSLTGRMMTNAGRTRSRGVECSVQATPLRNLEINAAYGLTDARFRRFETTEADAEGNPVRVSYRGRRIPYAPRHTLAAGAVWTIPTGIGWLGDAVLSAGIRSTGPVEWNEANTLRQPFYTLVDASLRFEHAHYALDLWGRNLTDAAYDVFHFRSIGNDFAQRGRPRTFGITLNIYI